MLGIYVIEHIYCNSKMNMNEFLTTIILKFIKTYLALKESKQDARKLVVFCYKFNESHLNKDDIRYSNFCIALKISYHLNTYLIF